MRRYIAAAFWVFLLGFARSALAGPVTITLTDASGKPLANAVVSLIAANGDQSTNQNLGPALPADAVIDQNHELFNPLVTVIRRGGRIVFTNSDTTMHQVYSFSPLKQFEYMVDRGQK